MPNRKIRRAYDGVEKQAFVPQHRFDPFGDGRGTGWIRVRWRIDPQHPVVIGAGWYELDKPKVFVRSYDPSLGPRRVSKRPLASPQPEVVAEIVRRGPERMPVLPGSSLKGAVRQVYELLTPSCQQGYDSLCRVKASDSSPEICPACSLFGTGGLGGRLAFGEAEPADAAWRQALPKVRTPTPWDPTKFEARTLKVYSQAKGEREEIEHSWSVSGHFASRLKYVNASDRELGLLFASLGLGAGSPMLRLGGKKYHGMGGVDVTIESIEQRYPAEISRTGEEAEEWAQGLASLALRENTGCKRAWDELHAALAFNQ